MMNTLVELSLQPPLATITLNDPDRRNAMGRAMFAGLESAIARVVDDARLSVLLLRAEGPVFCAGFDLTAAATDASLLPEFITRLSDIARSIRQARVVSVAAVQGAAIAGGCALVSACDHVLAAADARFGYPVHRIGVSPAVTIPTLQHLALPGPIRALLMSGDLISAVDAQRIGLVTRVVAESESLHAQAEAHCAELARKGQHALAITKTWLNELVGADRTERYSAAAQASAEAANANETQTLLEAWRAKRSR